MSNDWEWVLEIKPGQKGGPGSGHWGHAGRPGQRGGSAPGKMGGIGRVNRDYFTKGPGKELIASLSGEHRETVINVLSGASVQPYQLAGLSSISTDVPLGRDSWDVTANQSSIGQSYRSAGAYSVSLRKIYLNTEDGPPTKATISHELGHHITIGSDWRKTDRGVRAAKELGRVHEEVVRNFEAGAITPGMLGYTGLREYSLYSAREFMADSWKVFQYGGRYERQDMDEMLNSFGAPSLQELFGR